MTNKWITHVKEWATENGTTYSCAMADEKCKYAYRKENPIKGKGLPVDKVSTYRNKFNKKYGFDKNESHSIEEISKLTGYDMDGLQTIYNKGIGAYKTNPKSVRPEVKSAEQWAMARIYSAVMGGKSEKIDKEHLIKGGALADWFSADSWSKYATAVTQGRKDYPPKMREIIEKYGNVPILRMYACRTPLPSLLTSALNAVSFGEFSKRWENSPHDKLFHLDLRIELATRPQTTILLEKNEVLNAMVNPIPPGKNTQCSRIPKNKKITMLNLLEGAKQIQGDKFFRYSAYNNNCQDFIMAMLKGVGVGTQENFDFIKQDTKSLFKDLPGTRKFANTVTDLGAIVNTITEGAGIIRGRGAELEPTPEELFQMIYEDIENQLWQMFPFSSVTDITNGAMDLAIRVFNGEEINLDDFLQEEFDV